MQRSEAKPLTFDHTWLEVEWSDGSGEWAAVDPAWKFRDHRPTVRNMLDDVDFVTDPSTGGYFSEARTELPHEYYEAAVRDYLATNEPGVSISDIAYLGPILVQSVDALPTALPYDLWDSTVIWDGTGTRPVTTSDSVIPDKMTHRVRVSLLNDAETTTYFASNILKLSEISLLPLTVRPTPSTTYPTTHVEPELLLNWENDAASSFDLLASEALPAGGLLTEATVSLKLEHFDPDVNEGGSPTADRDYSFNREAGQYMAVQFDANQVSDALIRDERRALNVATVAYANELAADSNADPHLDDNIGRLLHLAGLKFTADTNEGEQAICDLTAGTRRVEAVASGITTASTTMQTWTDFPDKPQNPPANEPNVWDLQIPYLPEKLLIDIPNGKFFNVSIDSTLSSADETTRRELLGYTNSAMEHAIWEELTNIASISTVKSLQLAREDAGNDIVVITTAAQAEDLLDPDDDRNTGHTDATITSVKLYANDGYTVTIPEDPTPLGDWDGVGFTAFKTEEEIAYFGYIIIGGFSAATQGMSHGGYTTGAPGVSNLFQSQNTVQSSTNTVVGDPINVANGNVWHDETDISFPGLGFPLQFARHYDSGQTGDVDYDLDGNADYDSDRGLGKGWSFTYSDRLEDGASDAKIWYTSSGDRLEFAYDATNDVYITPDSVHGVLEEDVPSAGKFTWTDTSGSQVVFDANDRLESTADRHGNGVDVTYDANGNIDKVTDAVTTTRYLDFTYTDIDPGAGVLYRITSINDDAFTAADRTWTYAYDTNDRLWEVTAPNDDGVTTDEAVVEYQYYTDATRDGLLSKVIIPGGGTTEYTYYANRRGCEVTDPEGNVQSFSYNLFRKRTAFTDEVGVTSYYTVNDQANVVEELHPDRTTVEYEWADSLRQSATNAFGQQQTFHYDSNSNLTRRAVPDGPVTLMTYQDFSNFSNLQTTFDLGIPSGETEITFGALAAYGDTGGTKAGSGATLTLTGDVGAAVDLTSYTVTSNTILAFDFSSTDEAAVHAIGFDSDLTYTVSEGEHFQIYGTNTSNTILDHDDYDPTVTSVKHYVIPVGEHYTGTMSYLTFVQDTTDSTDETVFSNVVIYEADARTTDYRYEETDTEPDYGDLLEVEDALGNVTAYTYPSTNNRGLPETLTLPEGVATTGDADDYKATYVYNTEGQVESSASRASASQSVTHKSAYDDRGNLRYAVNPLGVTASVDPSSWGDDRGETLYSTEYEYDLLNRKTRELLPDPDGTGNPLSSPINTFTYDAVGNLTSTTDLNGRTTGFQHDKMQRVLKTTNPDGTYRTNTYGLSGDLAASTDQLGRVTRYYYDGRHRLVMTLLPDGSTVRTAYNGGLVSRVTDALGNTTEYEYDELGRKTKVILADPDPTDGDSSRPTTYQGYDEFGNLEWVTDARGGSAEDADHTTYFEYDELNRKTKQTAPVPGDSSHAAPTAYYGYDANGALQWVTDPRGSAPVSGVPDQYHTINYEYDELGRKITETVPDPDGAGDGDSDGTTLTAMATKYEYDANGALRYVIGPEGAASTDVYHTTEYVYDNLGRKISTILPDPDENDGSSARPTSDLVYDDHGRLESTTDPLDNTTWFTYNLLGRQTGVTDALGSAAGDADHTTTTRYDAVGNTLAVTDPLGRSAQFDYDARNRVVQETLPVADASGSQSAPQTTYAYDMAGNLLSTTDPLGDTTYFQYDDLNRQTDVTDALGAGPGDANHTVSTTYDEVGNVETVTDQLGRATTYEYNNLNRLAKEILPEIDVDGGGTATPTTYYVYDIAGNLLKVTDPLGSSAGDATHSVVYEYDNLNRKITETLPDPDGAGSLGQPKTYSGYDADGNLAYVADPRSSNRGDTTYRTTYEYDHLGRMTSETLPGPARAPAQTARTPPRSRPTPTTSAAISLQSPTRSEKPPTTSMTPWAARSARSTHWEAGPATPIMTR